jgi:hypothetical protein
VVDDPFELQLLVAILAVGEGTSDVAVDAAAHQVLARSADGSDHSTLSAK